jgi:hypothetical protein
MCECHELQTTIDSMCLVVSRNTKATEQLTPTMRDLESELRATRLALKQCIESRPVSPIVKRRRKTC